MLENGLFFTEISLKARPSYKVSAFMVGNFFRFILDAFLRYHN